MAISGHERPKMISDTWLTPPEIIKALGRFDLDPCCPPKMPWRTATKTFTKKDDGLAQKWFGRVWLNPPYSRGVVAWLRKMAEHDRGIVLTFARTDTAWFFETVWGAASAVLFIEGRLHFHREDGSRAPANAGAPSVLVAYGNEDVNILYGSGITGKFVDLRTPILRAAE